MIREGVWTGQNRKRFSYADSDSLMLNIVVPISNLRKAMKTARKLLFVGALGALIVVGLYANFALTAAGTAPSSTAGCALQPNGTWTTNGRICDRVDYTVFKRGMVPYVNPYFYHLIAEGWQFLNYSRGGSFFTFTTHNLVTQSGITLLQNQLYGSSTTTFTVQYLALSSNSAGVTSGGTDTVCNSEITEFALTRTLATYNAGTASANGNSPFGGTISPVLKATWTASGAYNGIQQGCAWNNPTIATSGTGTSVAPQLGTLFAENTFSSVNLNAGDQITITWTFTYSG
jgi:hypothetical protein